MILVDTSAWIEFFRSHEQPAGVVNRLIENNEAALCGPILTELMRGFSSQAEASKVLLLLGGCHFLSQPADLWAEAGNLGFLSRKLGRTIRSIDLLIACHALAHQIPLYTLDKDFWAIKKSGIPLILY